MAVQDIIVIGGSAGGLDALATVLTGLPPSFDATVFAVLHTSPQSCGALPQILERSVLLPVNFPADGEAIERGRIYVAPPDQHLTLDRDTIQVTRGPRENGFRPAIDPLFRSAAKEFQDRVVGVVLSGAMDDGTFGLMAVKEAGGTAIVQHPYEAMVPSMPLSAIQNVAVDHIVHAREMAPLLMRAAQHGLHPNGTAHAAKSGIGKKTDPTHRDIALSGVRPDQIPEAPSKFVCPECGGSLWEVEEGGLSRFRCFTGHGFTSDTLLVAQNGKLEHALWSAVRVLLERASLHRQLAQRTGSRGMEASASRYHDRAEQEEKHADIIRQMLSAASALAEPLPSPEVNQTV